MATHKWARLFSDYLAGRPVAPRRATELHGADLAAAVLVILRTGGAGAFNASDLLLDHHDLLAGVQRLTGCPHALPPRDTAPVSVMGCARLTGLGWRPGGLARLRAEMPAMVAAVTGTARFG